MNTLIEIKEPMISADKVLKRWPGILERELASMIDRSSDPCERLPTAYHVHKILNNGRGEIITECVPCEKNGNYYVEYQGNDTYYDFTGIAFIFSEISKYEDDNPKLLYQIVENIDDAWNSSHHVVEYFHIEDVRKSLQLSPYQFVRFLNDDSNPNRLITSWEEGFMIRLMDGGFGGSHVPFFSTEDLSNENLRVHRLDWEEFQQRKNTQEEMNITIKDIPPPTGTADTSALESQLALAQKEIESLSQWNKFLNEQNKKLRPELAEKDSRIADLESQLAISAESKAKRDNNAATIGKLSKDLQRWKAAFHLAVCATEKLLTHPAEATKKTRSELLSFICEACPLKCTEPKNPCAVFSGKQFESWRDALPLAHVDKSDKADKEDGLAYPHNTVETVGGEGNIEN